MYYRNVKIERDRNTVYVKLVPSHEVPVLKKVFDNVRAESGFVVTDRPYASIPDEYKRLVFVYGEQAVREAYPTEADMAKEIPLLAKIATAVVGFKLPTFGRQERADIPPATGEVQDRDFQSVREEHRAGMREAIEKALIGIPDHAAERERFNRE